MKNLLLNNCCLEEMNSVEMINVTGGGIDVRGNIIGWLIGEAINYTIKGGVYLFNEENTNHTIMNMEQNVTIWN